MASIDKDWFQIKACHRDVIRSLVACGAHLQLGSLELGEELCYLARLGFKKKISCFKLAGANLNSINFSKQTALHASVETGQLKVVQYLLENNIEINKRDVYGKTALDIAKELERIEIANLIERHLNLCQKWQDVAKLAVLKPLSNGASKAS